MSVCLSPFLSLSLSFSDKHPPVSSKQQCDNNHRGKEIVPPFQILERRSEGGREEGRGEGRRSRGLFRRAGNQRGVKEKQWRRDSSGCTLLQRAPGERKRERYTDKKSERKACLQHLRGMLSKSRDRITLNERKRARGGA